MSSRVRHRSYVDRRDDCAAPESAHHLCRTPVSRTPDSRCPRSGLLATLTAFVGSTTAYISGMDPVLGDDPRQRRITFAMFTVVHRITRPVRLFGRFMVVGRWSLPAWASIQRYSNDDEQDRHLRSHTARCGCCRCAGRWSSTFYISTLACGAKPAGHRVAGDAGDDDPSPDRPTVALPLQQLRTLATLP